MSAVVLMQFVQQWVVLTALLGGALFRVYSMAANVDVDNNSVYEVRRMPMTQQGQMYHTRAGSHHGSADTLAREVQSGRRAAVQQTLLIIVADALRSHGPAACWRQSDAHGLLTIGVSHALKVCSMWYCWLRSFKCYSHRLRPPKSRHDTPPHRAQAVWRAVDDDKAKLLSIVQATAT